MKINWELVVLVLIGAFTISSIVHYITETIMYKYYVKEITYEENKGTNKNNAKTN